MKYSKKLGSLNAYILDDDGDLWYLSSGLMAESLCLMLEDKTLQPFDERIGMYFKTTPHVVIPPEFIRE